MKHELTYCSHHGMIQRCYNPKCAHFNHYGGRGILTDPRYRGRGGMEAFMADVGPRPSEAYSLDRIDNEVGYFKGNMRWILKKDQPRNRRSNIMIEGVILEEASQNTGISRSKIKRGMRDGMTLDEMQKEDTGSISIMNAAKILKRTRITVYLWIKKGKLPARKTGGGVSVILRADVEKLAAQLADDAEYIMRGAAGQKIKKIMDEITQKKR